MSEVPLHGGHGQRTSNALHMHARDNKRHLLIHIYCSWEDPSCILQPKHAAPRTGLSYIHSWVTRTQASRTLSELRGLLSSPIRLQGSYS